MTAVDARPAVDGRIARGNRTRSQLLRSALTLFGSRGFHAVSMKDLAYAAGVKPASIYNHFVSKESILAAALVDGLQRFQAFVEAPDDTSADSLSRLEVVVRRHVAWQLSQKNPVREADRLLESVTSGELLTADSREQIQALLVRYRQFVMQIVEGLRQESGADLPPTSVCVAALLVLCDRVHLWHVDAAEVNPEEIETECWTLVLGMLRLRT